MWMLLIGLAQAGTPTVMTLGEASAPAGVAATWTLQGCNVRLRLENGTAAPIELDWMRSVYGPKGGAAVALVPGTSSKLSSMISTPPMVVPPGAFAEELLFRKDRAASDGSSCLFDVPSEATITLNVGGGWLVQPVAFAADPAWLAGEQTRQEAERARQAADASRRAAMCARDAALLRKKAKTLRTVGYVFGSIGLAGTLGLAIDGAVWQPTHPDASADAYAGAALVATGGGAIFIPTVWRGAILEHRAAMLGCK